MAPTALSATAPNGRAGKPATRAGQKRSHNRRTAVDQLLPDPVVTQLHRSACLATDITSELVAQLDRRFDIERQYGVSRRRLDNYLRRVLAARAGATQAESKSRRQPAPPQDGWDEKVQAHRRRQASVAAILDQTFGQLAKCNPDLWERRAYLMLIGVVYDRLATNESEIATDELVALAKVLAENRRAEAHSRKTERAEETSEDKVSPSAELPDSFADVVRQVYGTNFQPPDAQAGRTNCQM